MWLLTGKQFLVASKLRTQPCCLLGKCSPIWSFDPQPCPHLHPCTLLVALQFLHRSGTGSSYWLGTCRYDVQPPNEVFQGCLLSARWWIHCTICPGACQAQHTWVSWWPCDTVCVALQRIECPLRGIEHLWVWCGAPWVLRWAWVYQIWQQMMIDSR